VTACLWLSFLAFINERLPHCSPSASMGNSRAVDAPTIEQLNDELRDALLQVHQAQERKDERDVVAAPAALRVGRSLP